MDDGKNVAALCVCAAAKPRGAANAGALPVHSSLGPAAEEQENHCWNNKSKMLDKIKSLSTKVKNQHEECQCLCRTKRGREKDVLKYTFIQSLSKIKQQNWSTLPSCSAPSPQFPVSPSIDFPRWPSPWRLQAGLPSPLFRPEPWLLWDRFHWAAFGNDVFGGQHWASFTHTHTHTHTLP